MIVHDTEPYGEIFMPPGTYSKEEEEWRMMLSKNGGGEFVDYYCKHFGWCEARVMA